ncbi:serine/threonine-protein kinase RsbW [Methanofollis sp. W23]|uniref:ATP-binding protein n=1 Tax=Methanofollis sp. W23 TaxID=2817849 RepID=UPI001AE53896|nr:ATP-binding protein [Methanofollis sp. W23]MBP2145147.1 serine/threonine-protein kinase RsbW [Methanofollis sp. W23]
MVEPITVSAELSSLPEVLAHVTGALRTLGLPSKAVQEMELAVDEAVTNIVLHGYAGSEGWVRLSCARTGEGVAVVIEDAAPPFDPTAVPSPDLEGEMDERAIGGLGVHFIREMTDEMRYEYRDGVNVLKLFKHV